MEKKIIALITICILLAASTVIAMTTRMVFLFPNYHRHIEIKQVKHIVSPDEGYGLQGLNIEVHANIKQWRWIDGEKYLIYSYSHPANFTHYGINYTCAKLYGYDWYNTSSYTHNVSAISLGHDVGLNWLDTVLPGEWNRSETPPGLTVESLGIGNQNYTYSFYPGGSGTTNSTGLNVREGDNEAFTLWAYDTFSTISYTSNDQIDVEWQIIGPSAS